MTICRTVSAPLGFYKTHNCTPKGSDCERVLIEARKFFSADLSGSLDKVFVAEKLLEKLLKEDS
ncbi:hypothetical protein Pfo_022838 [Paulownia fortunei]|nr:hypothetical protein Pfo_022838 [Paulownia fortunei]